ncbi:hypothetical protein [Sinorhizobium meliloti]|nr:hypothetical protein [Sinorhizobium meliloti]
MLTPGLLEEWLATRLTSVPGTKHSTPTRSRPSEMGTRGPEQSSTRAKSGARDLINDIGRKVEFTDQTTGRKRTANLRELMAEAEGTPTPSRQRDASAQWQNVQHGMVALMDDLSQEVVKANGGEGALTKLIQTQAVQNVAPKLLAAAIPNR